MADISVNSMGWTNTPSPERVAEARDVLDGNWIGRATMPAPGLYPHQWNWDTGFIAIGRSRYDQSRAETEFLSLFRGQWANGMLPHIIFNPDVAADAYFPGPDFWQSERSPHAPKHVRTGGITQPPVHAFAALEMHRHAADPEQSKGFLRELFPSLVSLHRYFRDSRSGPEGLAFFLHPWESGLDNSPAWQDAFATIEIPAGALPPYERQDLKHGDPRDRPTNADYDRFVYLSILYRDCGYDDERVREVTPFLIEGPMFNAICASSAHALAEIAEIVGEDGREFAEDGERIVRALESKLWDGDQDRFFPFDVVGDTRAAHNSIVTFMPLIAPGLDASLAERTASALHDFRHCFEPICHLSPSHDIKDPDFDRRAYWRGPVWINTNWLLERGCRFVGAEETADLLRDSIFDLVNRHGFREYFDPHAESGYGADRFSWSAALYLDLAMRGE